jgi:type IV pilus assembly protein PilA
MDLSRIRKRAFSLVELMIVVAIIGVLSTLAIQGVRRYMANAKSAEARNALGTMARNAVDQYDKDKYEPPGVLAPGGTLSTLAKTFCGTAASNVPAALASVAAKKYQSNPTEWNAGTNGTGWKCLKFSVDSPQGYMYGYAATTTIDGAFTATAQGDLDGDGNPSKFEIFGKADNGVARFSPAIKETNADE